MTVATTPSAAAVLQGSSVSYSSCSICLCACESHSGPPSWLICLCGRGFSPRSPSRVDEDAKERRTWAQGTSVRWAVAWPHSSVGHSLHLVHMQGSRVAGEKASSASAPHRLGVRPMSGSLVLDHYCLCCIVLYDASLRRLSRGAEGQSALGAGRGGGHADKDG